MPVASHCDRPRPSVRGLLSDLSMKSLASSFFEFFLYSKDWLRCLGYETFFMMKRPQIEQEEIMFE